MATVTRVELGKAVQREAGLSRKDSEEFVAAVLETISDALTFGEAVKISSFGSFELRHKAQRMGRNPATQEEAPVSARRVVTFRASAVLKNRVDGTLPVAGQGAQA